MTARQATPPSAPNGDIPAHTRAIKAFEKAGLRIARHQRGAEGAAVSSVALNANPSQEEETSTDHAKDHAVFMVRPAGGRSGPALRFDFSRFGDSDHYAFTAMRGPGLRVR